MIPTVLVAHHSRPMCAGLFFDAAFRQAGCHVVTAGPCTPSVYGRPSGGEHVFPDEDFELPQVELPNHGCDVLEVVQRAERFGPIDLVVMVDQLDDFFLGGQAPPAGTAFAYICVENWSEQYAARIGTGKADFIYHMIRHTQTVPFPRECPWLPFGFDPFIHPLMPQVPRTRAAVQIGTPYDPRPAVWNHLRARFDQAPPVSSGEYAEDLYVTDHTIFGRTPSYRGMAEFCNEAKTALSSSNCDFSPMRTCEAYAMGSVLVSDDVPAIRGVLGPPLSEGGFWVAHDRTPEGHYQAVCAAVEAYDDIIDRGIAHIYKAHTYKHRAEQILRDAGLVGACRMVA